MPELAIPPPQTNDSEDVHWALSTAASLWASGARQDALRWLRRAAEAANDRDDEIRALELFRAAAEIRESFPPPAPASNGKPVSLVATYARTPSTQAPPSRPPPLPPVRAKVDKTEASPLPPPATMRAPVSDPPAARPVSARPQHVRPLPKPTPPPPRNRSVATEPPPQPQERTASGSRPAISQHPAPAVLPALRLALLPAGSGGELRVALLGQDESPPSGSVTGVFVPTSDADAVALLNRLGKSKS